eukprot:TRINITY_DN83377_c0_g1_i1.p1 TRINITY_DN83377_c0_g1~~TRINITY_DN83377_c0_g1_i1.p1  ORF type:complete len:257 (-),score=32.07 TRINITY_DN83377_c0_g1_i1:55-756(-)
MQKLPRRPPDFTDRDPAKVATAYKQQVEKEEFLFRSFCRPLKADSAKTQDSSFSPEAFLSPPPRKPGLVLRNQSSEGAAAYGFGDQVRIGGITRRKELNGVLGRIVNHSPDEFGRLYVDIGKLQAGCGQAKVIKIRPDRLEADGDDPDVPSWMPKGVQKADPLGSSHWSTTGMRCGFPGFGLIHSKSLSQSEPKLPSLSGEKLRRTIMIGHRSASRTTSGGFFPEAGGTKICD